MILMHNLIQSSYYLIWTNPS